MQKYYNERKNQHMIGQQGTPEELDQISEDVSSYSANNAVEYAHKPTGEKVADFATDMALNMIGTGAYTSLGKGVSALAKEEQVVSGLSKFIPKELPGSPNSLEGLGYNPVKSGFGNPLAIADALIPMPTPQQLLLMGMPLGNRMSLSPMNLMPGYGTVMKGEGQAFRKFGNSMDDIIERQLFGPSGGSKFRIGRDQIVNEGNWANAKNFDEAYSGVFGAKVNPKVEGTNLSYSRMSNRNGVLIRDKAGNLLPDIPIEDPGLTFHRRLPFSNRYVPINKQKLIDKKFQLATQLPYVQSLGEKYVTGLGYAGLAGAMGAPEVVDLYNKYTGVTEAKKWTKDQYYDFLKYMKQINK